MPLRSSIIYLLLSLIFICASLDARSPLWKPERILGSAQLAMEDIRYIVVPPDSSDALSAAFKDMVGLWPLQIEIKQMSEEPAPPKQSLVLVRDSAFALRGYGVACLDDRNGGFSILRDRTRVYLRASTDEGLVNGLYAICRELLGARWYWGGDLGFERVEDIADKFPDRVWREQPAFVQRTLYPVGSDYGRRNGLNRKYSFNHNLARIFTKEVFEESPEVFAEIDGTRRGPKRSAKYDPQPDFTEPKAVELAAKAARAHFEKNPNSNSFSLSINDNSLFDEGLATAEAVLRGQMSEDRGQMSEDRGQMSEDSRQEAEGREQGAVSREKSGGMGEERVSQISDPGSQISHPTKDDGGIEYFRGRPNYTDLVFGFMNRVAEQVFREQRTEGRGQRAEAISEAELEDDLTTRRNMSETSNIGGNLFEKIEALASGLWPLTSAPKGPYLTALAYYWTEQSPSFQVHPKVMPVLTSDRAQWHDPLYRAEDKALIERWANSGAERIATWDYYFGAPYPYPRQFTQWIGESIKYLHDSGVDVFFSQLPSVWGLDGPKAWLTTELLRDPEQDVEQLLDEFYTNFFGPAAEPIREFYEIAEQTRNEREGPANWIKFYKDEAGIELFDEATLKRMRACIDDAEGKLNIAGSEIRASALREPQSLEPVEMVSVGPTKDNRFAKRVQVVSDAFSYSESYANYHRSRVRLVEESMRVLRADFGKVDGDRLIRILANYQTAKASFRELAGLLVKKPMQGGLRGFARMKKSEPIALAVAALARADHDLEDSGLQMHAGVLRPLRAWYGDDARLFPVVKNPGLKHSGTELRNFLGPEVQVMDAWRIQYRASEGLRLEAAEGANGEGLRIENADIVSLSQKCPVMGEKFYLLQIEASWQVSPDNRTWVQLNWESIGGEDLQMDLLLRLPNGTSEGSQLLQFAFQAPVNAYDLKVGIVTNRQYEGDYLEIERVELGSLMPKR